MYGAIQYSRALSAGSSSCSRHTVFAMAPGSFETHVYSLQSALGVSHDQRSGADPQQNSLGPSQSCFALEGSSAATRSLHQRHRANNVPWNQGVVFDQSCGIGQPQIERSMVQVATSTSDRCPTSMSVDACDVVMAAPGYGGLDNHQYTGNVHPSSAGYRYSVFFYLFWLGLVTLHCLRRSDRSVPVDPQHHIVLRRHSL